MGTHRTTYAIRTTALAAVFALCATTSCGSDESDVADTVQPAEGADEASTDEPPPDATVEVSGAVGDAAAALEEAVLMLEGVSFLEPALFVLDDPFEEYDAAIEMYTLTIESLQAIRTEFPDVDAIPPQGSDAYTAVLQHMDEWAELAANWLAELEDQRSDLEPLLKEWAAAVDTGDPGSAPQDYAALVGGNPDAFEEFGQRCAEFAVSIDLAVNCFGTTAPGADGSIEFSAGNVTYVVDPGPIDEFIVRPDVFGADLSPYESMSIYAPVPVRDPAAAIEPDATDPDGGPALEHTIPWPDDIDEYLAASPFEVLNDVTFSTPSGEFRRLTVTQDAQPVMAFIDAPLGVVSVWTSQPFTLWIGEIDGQTIVATLEGADSQAAEALTHQVDEVLRTLHPVS